MDGLVLTCRVRINFLSILLFLVGFVIGGFLMSKMFLTRKVESPMMLNNFNYEHKLATKLFHEAKILCLVMTNPNNHRTKADHVKNTWGRRCNKLLFITTQDDDELDTIVVAINESRQALRRKTKTGFLYVHENYLDEYDWFMKADDDSYVVMENLRYMLSQYRTETAFLFGHRHVYNKTNMLESYMTGGCYILSRKALSKMAAILEKHPQEFFWPDQSAEDVEVGKALAHNAIFVDTRDEQHQMRFFTVSVLDHLAKIPSDYWYFQRMYYDVAQGNLSCCSDVAISFHYAKPKLMYLFEYFIYRNNLFGLEKNLTETLPRKLTLSEIITASDARRPVLDSLYDSTLTNVHYLDSSEEF